MPGVCDEGVFVEKGACMLGNIHRHLADVVLVHYGVYYPTPLKNPHITLFEIEEICYGKMSCNKFYSYFGYVRVREQMQQELKY